MSKRLCRLLFTTVDSKCRPQFGTIYRDSLPQLCRHSIESIPILGPASYRNVHLRVEIDPIFSVVEYPVDAYHYATFHRNVVLEALQEARELGAEAEQGFCAVLSTTVAIKAMGAGATTGDLKACIAKEIG